MAHELYNQLQHAYDFFNQELFSGRLPACLITVQRENECVHGYFSFKRFGSKDQKIREIDEIAMNPIYFVNARIENVLSTLVHEMVHLEQAHFGSPGRGRYHNKQWADWMTKVGLMPSHTGEEAGHQTGDQMTHYIIRHGKFDLACQKLINKNFEITWYDQRIHYSQSFIKKIALEPVNYGRRPTLQGMLDAEKAKVAKEPLSEGDDSPALLEPEAVIKLKKQLRLSVEGTQDNTDNDGEDLNFPVKPTPSKKKTAYLCPSCGIKVWGRPNLESILFCKQCDTDFIEQ